MKEIIKRTIELLERNKEWENRYSQYIKQILQVKDGDNSRSFRTPEGLSLYSSVSRRNGKTYDLRFKGQSVGIIVCNEDEIILRPRYETNKKFFNLELPECVSWYSPEASAFRKCFRDMAKGSSDIKLKSPEHRIENRLLKEFSKRRRSEGKALCNIQPVKLYGCYFQFPTPVKASGHGPEYSKQYGGGIDILARIKTIEGDSRLCIMEVKDENKESESQTDAMTQAIIYATFIAHLLRNKSGQKWWNFFMNRDCSSSPIPNQLNLDVVTIMPEGNTDEFVENIVIPQLSTTLHCHSIYYNTEELKNDKFVFTGTFPQQVKP